MDTQKVFKVAIITIRTGETKLKEEGTLDLLSNHVENYIFHGLLKKLLI